jgi:hypothetical protein
MCVSLFICTSFLICMSYLVFFLYCFFYSIFALEQDGATLEGPRVISNMIAKYKMNDVKVSEESDNPDESVTGGDSFSAVESDVEDDQVA